MDRVVPAVQAGQARLPRKADRVVQGNRISMADQVARVFREVDRVVLAGRVVQGSRMGMADLQAPVDRVGPAGRAPIKQGPLVVLGKAARGASPGSRHAISLTANSSRAC